MLKFLLRLIFIIGAAAAVLYLTPADIKTKALNKMGALISQVVPDSVETAVKEKTEPFLVSPASRRAALMDQLETNLADIKKNLKNEKPDASAAKITESAASSTDTAPPIPASPETAAIIKKIEEAEALLKKLDAASAPPNAVATVTTSIIEKTKEVLGAAPSPAPQTCTPQ